MSHPISQNGRPLAVRELLRRAWGGSHLSEAQLRNHVVQLRKKLALLEAPAALVNDPGLGYWLRFDSPDAAASARRTNAEPTSA
jgi:DNA-binding response OmpR family regulator